MRTTRLLVSSLSLAAALAAAGSAAAQILETETARRLPRGAVEASLNFELQHSSEGREVAAPFAIEVGLARRLELLVEPVFYTAIRPHTGPRATGFGDVEVTATWLARAERGGWPALALAGELKLPTANDPLIGTGRTDFAGYLIASKLMGPVDVHANLGYTVVGQPAGTKLSNIVNGALGAVYRRSAWELFGEVLGTTAAVPGGEGGGGPSPTPEAPGAERVTTVGAGRRLLPGTLFFLAVSYDNNGAVLIHPGITLRLR